jgi:hypothetical protein
MNGGTERWDRSNGPPTVLQGAAIYRCTAKSRWRCLKPHLRATRALHHLNASPACGRSLVGDLSDARQHASATRTGDSVADARAAYQNRTDGLLRTGKALSQTELMRRNLLPLLMRTGQLSYKLRAVANVHVTVGIALAKEAFLVGVMVLSEVPAVAAWADVAPSLRVTGLYLVHAFGFSLSRRG